MVKKILVVLLNLTLILFFSFFYLRYIHLEEADLGRFLQNGRQFIEGNGKNVLDFNFYSYTEPNHSFLNHHWLTSLVFYVVYLCGDFKLLSLFSALINGITVFILYILARQKFGISLSLFLVLPYLIFSKNRSEVRPEIFSWLFLMVFLYLLNYLKSVELTRPKRCIYFLIFVVMQILWVNLHIFFFFAFILIGCFVLDSLMENNKTNLYWLLKLFAALLIASCINPHGIYGLLEPFVILRSYGIVPTESYSLLKLLFSGSIYISYFFINYLFVIFGMVYVFWRLLKLKKPTNLVFYILFGIFSFLAWSMVRLSPLFGLGLTLILMDLCEFGSLTYLTFNQKYKRFIHIVSMSVIFLVYLTLIFNSLKYFGLGLYPGVDRAARYFIENNLSGPVFNDFDIGGYLIFYLYPQEKIFIDNRPEAYSVDFIQNIYLPSISTEKGWQTAQEKYKFKTVFMRNTLEASNFARIIKKDPSWKLAYNDKFAIIYIHQ